MRIDKRLYSNLNGGRISLSGMEKGKRTRVGFILFPKVKGLFSKHETSDPLVFEKDGRLFLSVPFIVPTVHPSNETCICVDLGMRRFITTSEGKCLVDRGYNGRRRKVMHLKRQLQAKGTKSARKGCRYYCADGQVLDADWNAAVNIGLRSRHPVSKRLPIDGKLLLTGRLNVNQPNVSGVQVKNTCS